MSVVPTGVYTDPVTPWWSLSNFGTPANLQVSTLTVNSLPAGNILLTHTVSSGTEYNAPLIFQRPPLDINQPSESLAMNTSISVPTKPVDGEYITATKAAGTAYDDIAVAGLQIYGDQTTSGNSGAVAYITGNSGNLILAPQNSVYVSSLFVSTLTATTVVSTTATTGTSLTLTQFLSTPLVKSDYISSIALSTSQIVSKDIFTSTLTVSTLNAPNFAISTVNANVISSIFSDTKVSLTSTLTLLGISSVNLGLGDVIQGLVGGAATQALGVGIGTAALITGAAALTTGRTSGGVNSNVFQTINGSTQLQFSTIGQAVSSIFLTTNSSNPLTTPGIEIRQSNGVPAGTYCVRSVGDPLYINNNVSSIQMFGQWVPVIQPTATVPALGISSLTVSSINGLPPGGGGAGITSTIAISTATVNGNLSSIGAGQFKWGGTTLTNTQTTFSVPVAINNTLTTTGGAFLNAGASVLSGLTVSGGINVNTGNVTIQGTTQMANSLTIFGPLYAQNGIQVSGPNAQFNPPTVITNTLNVGLLTTLSGSVQVNGPTAQFNTSINVNTGSLVLANGNLNVNNGNISGIIGNYSNINISSINGTSYPPPGTVIPSSIALSTATFTGNILSLNPSGSMTMPYISTALISTNGIGASVVNSITGTWSNINVSSVNGQVYPPASGTPILPSTIFLSTVNVNGGINVSNGGISSIYATHSNVTLSSINGSAYPPPGTPIPSTINLSTVNVNGGLAVSNGPLTAQNIGCFNFSSIRGSIRTLNVDGGVSQSGVVFTDVAAGNTGGNIEAIGGTVTLYLDPSALGFNIQNGYTYGENTAFRLWGFGSGYAGTGQFFSTLTVSQNPPSNPNEACIQTYNASAPGGADPKGSVYTKAISTQTIQVSSINGVQIPYGLGVPTGTVMLWGGTTEADPFGYYICDGRRLDIATNPALYAVIGLSYYNDYPNPIAPGTFYLPDLTFAIPQGAPKANYAASFTVTGNYQPTPGLVNIMQNVPGVPPNDTLKRIWKIVSIGAGTINVGTLIPGGQYAGQTANLYIQSIVQTDPATGLPSYIAIQSVDGSSISVIPQGVTVSITCSGVYRQPTPPLIQNFWAAGTYNELAFTNAGSNGPATEPPSKRNVRTQQGVEVGVHTHPYVKYGQFGSTGLVNGNEEPSKGNATFQTGDPAQNITDLLGNTWAAPYPTKPNVINMFYIIKS